MNKKENKILLFFKGFLMGICDLIPGISGGTIAFITGIYERLINAVKGFSLKLLGDFIGFISGNKSKSIQLIDDIKKLDLAFLITLLLGVFSAILLGSRLVEHMLTNYPSYTLTFFVGLILASSKIIYDNISDHKLKNVLFGLIGLIIGILLSVLIPVNINPSLFYVFFGGFIAISAMFLPGISGSFILLIMGLYSFLLNALNNPFQNPSILGVFIIGAILGAFFISRLISKLFEKDKCKTLYLLLGLVVGALSIPLKTIYHNTLFSVSNLLILTILLIAGIIVVRFVLRYDKEVFGE